MGIFKDYEFCGSCVRTITDKKGHVWWSMKDLVVALDLEESAMQWWLWLECEEKDNKSFISPRGRQYLRVVNRGGLRKMLDDSPRKNDFLGWVNGIFRINAAARAKKKENFSTQSDKKLLSPTKIGRAVGGLSAQQVNKLLENIGFQMSTKDFNRKRYLPIGVGKHLSVESIATKENGEEVSYLLWIEPPIVKLVAARLRAEERNSAHV